MSPVILKIGGSVITEKDSVACAKQDEIDRIAHEIASFKTGSGLSGGLILVHGAGSFGHPQAMKWLKSPKTPYLNTGTNTEFDAEGIYLIHKSVKVLNSMLLDSLNSAGVHALPVHPLSSCVLENGKILVFQTAQLCTMLDRGIVPVLHGDVVMDRIKGASVLSGDRIIPYLASVMRASIIGAGSNVDGVLDDSGAIIKKITPGSFSAVKKHIRGSTSTDVTGGMLGKVSEFLELAGKGVSSRIFNANTKGMVSRFLYGEDVGTLIIDK